ncbi:MAG TPA: TlpA disulfide reductase family protein [Tepidisphaeraceae bacterium]|nr:TlpA disulfide reductase family protein [Tepidisphaeraceae bacterium]
MRIGTRSAALAITSAALALGLCPILSAEPDAPAATAAEYKAAGAGMKLLTSGAMPKLGGYRPQLLKMFDKKPDNLKKAPELSSPLYGSIKFGGKSYLVVLDEPADKEAKLYVDANGNGDLTDDPATKWEKRVLHGPNGQQVTQYTGSFKLPLQTGDKPTLVSLGAYRFDKNDPMRAALKNVFLYYSDYAYEGQIKLGDAKYKAMLADPNATGDFSGAGNGAAMLLIDVNGDGRFAARGETFDASKPFNIKGTTWELADLTAGGSFKVAKSDKTVEEILPPPNLTAGQKALAFKAVKMDGSPVNFPADYKGKLVMLDFWATWCGPCMGEVPGLVKAYNEYHPKGIEILGISLDQPNASDKVKKVTGEKGMTWPQVYDGKFWQAQIAQKYGIQSIPAAFLVDGDTGKILAAGNALRGESLAKTWRDALDKKAAKKPASDGAKDNAK